MTPRVQTSLLITSMTMAGKQSCSGGHTEDGSKHSYHSVRPKASVHSLNSAFSSLTSSTMTASDLPGPGRILDKYIFTKGGRALERVIARIAHAWGFGPAAAALRIGENLRGFSLDDFPSSASIMSSEVASQKTLRLDLGLVHDVSQLRTDWKKLINYSKADLLSTRVHALTMIVILYIRFPYVSTYFDSAELAGYVRAGTKSPYVSEDDSMEASLAQMAIACLAPAEHPTNVTRLVDHLTERTKHAEENPHPQSTGPHFLHLPDTRMIREYCENAHTSFAALRFTSIVFRHSFLSRANEFYVKLNRPTITGFWSDLVKCMDHLVRKELMRPCSCSCMRHCRDDKSVICTAAATDTSWIESDSEGVDFFSETICEMLYRALAWDALLPNMKPSLALLRDALIRDVIEIFDSPMAQRFFPNASFTVLAKLKSQIEILRTKECSIADSYYTNN